MTDNLPTRLREASTEDRAEVDVLMREAADRIEALKAELARTQHAHHWANNAGEALRDQRDAARAVIAEALARSENGAHSTETPAFTLIAVRTILRRVPQGAAEPNDGSMEGLLRLHGKGATEPTRCICDGGSNFTEAENRARIPFITNDDCLIHGHLHREGAAKPRPALFEGTSHGQEYAEPGTDPEPWRDSYTGVRFDRQNLLTLAYVNDPRTRAQYDAEEGNR